MKKDNIVLFPSMYEPALKKLIVRSRLLPVACSPSSPPSCPPFIAGVEAGFRQFFTKLPVSIGVDNPSFSYVVGSSEFTAFLWGQQCGGSWAKLWHEGLLKL